MDNRYLWIIVCLLLIIILIVVTNDYRLTKVEMAVVQNGPQNISVTNQNIQIENNNTINIDKIETNTLSVGDGNTINNQTEA